LGLEIPNFVFTSALYYNTNYNIIAGTHENGHAVGGLQHAVDVCGQSYGNDGNWMGAGYSASSHFFSISHLIVTCGQELQISILTDRTK